MFQAAKSISKKKLNSPLWSQETLIGWLPVIVPFSVMSFPSSTIQSSRGLVKRGGSRSLVWLCLLLTSLTEESRMRLVLYIYYTTVKYGFWIWNHSRRQQSAVFMNEYFFKLIPSNTYSLRNEMILWINHWIVHSTKLFKTPIHHHNSSFIISIQRNLCWAIKRAGQMYTITRQKII